ncbi:hypothetical protein G7078_06025 [Sphingomonas sinipercae]|uniref:Circumsporozoite protein n=1 Tax=Sphingomonas sinipercae TaxID=2714944 RepID=A0A6G7ZN93_9SPHN|nr:hypothetical protein [Sphingomonas sinipercae]QIL02392.1 hypothetical protein G7078_06025 [Sphingomonas sinipercae]
MRILFALPLLLAAAACNVSKDDNGVTVQYDQNTAEDAVSDAGNVAENVGGAIVNDVEKTADKVQNTDIDVKTDVDTNTADGNKQ